MHRFFISPEQIESGRVYLNGPDVKHISRVLRLVPGNCITLLDGRGKAYEAVIEKTGREEIVCIIREECPAGGAPPLRVTLAQGIPKGDKMDLVVQKSTELGVSRVIPLICTRSVVKLEGDKLRKRQGRWQRIALESAKQCRRPDVPEVWEPTDWERVLAELPPQAAAVIPWEDEKVESLKDFLQQNVANKEIYVFIGPEGGFDAAEVERARARGVRPVTLGSRILRSETAGLVVLTMIFYQWGDLGGRADERKKGGDLHSGVQGQPV